MPLQVVVMGVSSTGKSTVAASLARTLGWPMVEGDELHTENNLAKMERGEPLDDDDRAPWLDRIGEAAQQQEERDLSSVITCSALKRAYRDRLRSEVSSMFFVHLAADYDVLEPRMEQREGHFMPTRLLRSQFETLEPLAADEDGRVVDVSDSPEVVDLLALDTVLERLRG